jgi:hypothetical protein
MSIEIDKAPKATELPPNGLPPLQEGLASPEHTAFKTRLHSP